MKILGEYCLRNVMDENLLIRTGDGSSDVIYTLGETGAFIWSHITAEATAASIAAAMCEEYDVTEAQAVEDVKKFLDVLVEEKLIEL